MNTSVLHRLSAGITVLALLWGSAPALAGQRWLGSGRIISGSGQGALVDLEIKVEGDQVQFRSGPSKNELVRLPSLLQGETETTAGKWYLRQVNNGELSVSLIQANPYRVIRYSLLRARN